MIIYRRTCGIAWQFDVHSRPTAMFSNFKLNIDDFSIRETLIIIAYFK